MKTTDFITENQFIGDDAHAMHQDHEVQMARSDCYSSAKYAIELHKLLKNVSEMTGLDGWVSEKLTLANDYLRTVHEYLTHEMVHPEEAMPEMFTAESAEIQFAELLGEGGRLDMSSPEEKAARKAYIKAHGHPPPLTPDSVVAKYNPENDKKMRDYYLRRKGIPQDKLDKMKEDGHQVSPAVDEGYFSDQDVQRKEKQLAGTRAYHAKKKAEKEQRSADSKAAFGNMFGGSPAELTSKLKIREQDVQEAGPGDINRLEHRGEEYNVYFNQRKGMYTARGTGQMKGQIQFEWFHTLADAIDHAEMEIGGYDEHDGVAEGYWQDALKKVEADREAHKGKPFEKNPASHDKQGVYKGDKDLAGNPVPKRKEQGVAETTSSAGMATAPGVGKGPATGTLFGGSYAPKTPFTGKKKSKTSVIKR